MFSVDETVLYEQFLRSRERAIALTDRFRASNSSDAAQAELWNSVMRETETARLLLERWLRAGYLTEQGPPGENLRTLRS
jgi:hypothetical protein